jgi:hypothetical protein
MQRGIDSLDFRVGTNPSIWNKISKVLAICNRYAARFTSREEVVNEHQGSPCLLKKESEIGSCEVLFKDSGQGTCNSKLSLKHRTQISRILHLRARTNVWLSSGVGILDF